MKSQRCFLFFPRSASRLVPLLPAIPVVACILLLFLALFPDARAQTSIGLSPAFTTFSDDTDFSYGVAWGDVDGDGDLDLAIGNRANDLRNKLYINESGMLQPVAAWNSGHLSDVTASVAWGDMDGDGDLDLAISNAYAPPARVFRNVGGFLQTNATWTSADTGGAKSAVWGDVNGDGHLDLAVGCRAYLNTGTGTLQTSTSWIPTDGCSGEDVAVAWGDMDGDGDLDLVAGIRGDTADVRVYLNVAGALQTTAAWYSTDGGGAWTVAWGDADGDGDLDLAAGNNGTHNGIDRVFLNEGGMLNSTPAWVGDAPGATYYVAWGDVDTDGDLDLAVGRKDTNLLYLNVDGELQNPAIWLSCDESDTNSIAWGDVDGDSDIDLATANASVLNLLYMNQSIGMQPAAKWTASSCVSASSVAWGDVDGDGDLDLAVGCHAAGETHHDRVYLNTGGWLQTAPSWTSSESRNTSSLAWGDVDGDGDLDLAAGTVSGRNRVYLNQNEGLENTASWTSNDSVSTWSLAWGDVDGDGDLDLAAGNEGQNRLYLNDNGALQRSAAWTSADSDRTEGVVWGDVDGDGDLDLAAGNWFAANRVYLNVGGMLQRAAAWTSSDADFTDSVAWGDVDGDGDLDLAAGNHWRFNKVYLNHDGALERAASWSSYDDDATRSIAWGDVDGDGDLDLAAGNSNGDPDRIYLNESGVLQAGSAWPSADTVWTYGIAWGDMDGDGNLDLAAAGNGGARVYVNRRPASPLYPGRTMAIALDLNSEPMQTFSQTVTTPAFAPANFHALAGVRADGTIPITFTLYDSGLAPISVRGYYSLDGGGRWSEAIATNDTMTSGLASGCLTRATPSLAVPPTDVVSSTLQMSNESQIYDLEVSLTISHTQPSQLQAALQTPWPSPTGTAVLLFAGAGGSGQGFRSITLGDQYARSIAETAGATTTVSGVYRPLAPLSALRGAPLDIPLTLVITNAGAGTGTLEAWSLKSLGGTGVYTWDVFHSGFFGQSDNVVFRLLAYPVVAKSGALGSYRYPNALPGPYQWPYAAATTFPFRVRGTQVRVYSGTVAPGHEVADALVYRLPAGQSTGGFPMSDHAGRPFRTDGNGYLQGRGAIAISDTLVALLPISATESYTLYYTSAAPTPTGLEPYTVDALGVQTLAVSSTHPLILFDLDVSLEWDARNDALFMSQLEYNLQRTSALLYDWTDGQAALGRVTVYHDRDHWNDAHVRLYATNRLRPNAAQGGIVSEVISDTDVPTLTYAPGQVHIGAVWNRYGEPGGGLGEAGPRAGPLRPVPGRQLPGAG
jgi:hypothetical protein